MSIDPNRMVTEQRLFAVLSRLLPGTDVDTAFEQPPPPPQIPPPIPPPPPRVDPELENWRRELQASFDIGLLRQLIQSDATGNLTDAEILALQNKARRR
jgi:hypothetical protein